MSTQTWISDPFVLTCIGIICGSVATIAVVIALSASREATGDRLTAPTSAPATRRGRHRL